jgi:hypothetical protein
MMCGVYFFMFVFRYLCVKTYWAVATRCHTSGSVESKLVGWSGQQRVNFTQPTSDVYSCSSPLSGCNRHFCSDRFNHICDNNILKPFRDVETEYRLTVKWYCYWKIKNITKDFSAVSVWWRCCPTNRALYYKHAL